MFYQQFLSALVQLSSCGEAHLSLEEKEISLSLIEGSLCRVKTLLYAFEERIPSSFLSEFGGSRSLTWHPGAPKIEIDTASGCIFLTGHLAMQQGEYLHFKEEMRLFLSLASEWQEIHSCIV